MQREMLKAWRSKAPEDSSDLLDAMEADNAFFWEFWGAWEHLYIVNNSTGGNHFRSIVTVYEPAEAI
jgi:hypothetical protein